MEIASVLRAKGNKVYSTSKDTPLRECIHLMNEKRIGSLVIVDEDYGLEGIMTERDILRALDTHPKSIYEIPVQEIMTPKEKLVTTEETNSVEAAMNIMTENRIRHLPITNNQKLVGIISIGDVVKYRLEQTFKLYC